MTFEHPVIYQRARAVRFPSLGSLSSGPLILFIRDLFFALIQTFLRIEDLFSHVPPIYPPPLPYLDLLSPFKNSCHLLTVLFTRSGALSRVFAFLQFVIIYFLFIRRCCCGVSFMVVIHGGHMVVIHGSPLMRVSYGGHLW